MLNIHNIVFKIVVTSIILLLIGAYLVEYYMHIPPCKFCTYQRILYVVAIIICILGILLPKLESPIAVLANLVLLGIAVISCTQMLVEYGFFPHTFACQAIDPSAVTSVEDFKNKLLAADLVTCDNPYRIFHISLAGYSFIFSTVATIFVFLLNLTHIFFKHEGEKHSS
jgi:disulfide bond formation protein DsbB